MALRHLGGRANEVSRSRFSDLDVHMPAEFNIGGAPHTGLVASSKHVIAHSIIRDKQLTPQTLHVFVHSSTFLLCYYFSLGYYLVVTNSSLPEGNGSDETNWIFPASVRHEITGQTTVDPGVNNERNAGRRDELGPDEDDELREQTVSSSRNRSKVSKFVSDVLEELQQMATEMQNCRAGQNFSEEDEELEPMSEEQRLQHASSLYSKFTRCLDFNNEVSSHSCKRNAANMLAQHPGVNPLQAIGRLGYVLASLLTVIEYLDNQPFSDRQCGRVQAGWNINNNPAHSAHGGFSPTLQALGIDREGQRGHTDCLMAQSIARHLFRAYDDRLTDTAGQQLKDILFATILMRLDDYIDVLMDHPMKDFGSIIDGNRNHGPGGTRSDPVFVSKSIFLSKIRQAVHIISHERGEDSLQFSTLIEWGKKIRRRFLLDNYAYVDIGELTNEFGSTAFQTDGRSLVALLNELGQGQARVYHGMHDQTNEILAEMRAMRAEVQEVRRSNKRHRQELRREMNRVVDSLQDFMEVVSQRLVSGGASVSPSPSRRQRTDTDNTGGGGSETESSGDEREVHEPSQRDAADTVLLHLNTIPTSMDRMTSLGAFTSFFVNRWYHLCGDAGTVNQRQQLFDGQKKRRFATIKSCIRYTVNVLYLYLEEHIAYPPDSSTHWHTKVKQLTRDAWDRAKAALQIESTSLSTCKKKLHVIDPSSLPAGPSVGIDHRLQYNLLTREELIDQINSNRAKSMKARATKASKKQQAAPGAAPMGEEHTMAGAALASHDVSNGNAAGL